MTTTTLITAPAGTYGGTFGGTVPALTSGAIDQTSPVTVGTALTVSGSNANGPSDTFQWNRNGSPISGATSAGYTTVAGDSGATITRTVTSGLQSATTAGITVGSTTELYTKIGDYSPANGTTVTVVGAIPSVGAARKYIVQYTHNTISTGTCTIAGVTATQHVNLQNDGLAINRMFIADVPSGTSGNIVITGSANMEEPRVRLGWVPTTATVQAAVTAGSSANNATYTVTQAVGAGSCVLVGSAHRGGAGSQVWTANIQDIRSMSTVSNRATFGTIPLTTTGTETITVTESGENETRRADAYSVEITP